MGRIEEAYRRDVTQVRVRPADQEASGTELGIEPSKVGSWTNGEMKRKKEDD